MLTALLYDLALAGKVIASQTTRGGLGFGCYSFTGQRAEGFSSIFLDGVQRYCAAHNGINSNFLSRSKGQTGLVLAFKEFNLQGCAYLDGFRSGSIEP